MILLAVPPPDSSTVCSSWRRNVPVQVPPGGLDCAEALDWSGALEAFEAAALAAGSSDAEPQADSSGTIRLNAIAVLIVCAARPETGTSIQALP
jgi:hypothetical protein